MTISRYSSLGKKKILKGGGERESLEAALALGLKWFTPCKHPPSKAAPSTAPGSGSKEATPLKVQS